MCYTNQKYDFRFFQFSTWPKAAILIWKSLRLNDKMDISNVTLSKYNPINCPYLSPWRRFLKSRWLIKNKKIIGQICVIHLEWLFNHSKCKTQIWPMIFLFQKFQYGRQQPSWFLKTPPWGQFEFWFWIYSAFYIFFPSPYSRKSDALGLLLMNN